MVENLDAYLAIQHKEVLEHKYYMSEKVGYDVGIDNAYMDWACSPRAAEFRKKYDDNIYEINKYCNTVCGGPEECSGLEKCIADLSEIHKIFHDG